MKKIEVEGHSGCYIEIQKREDGLVIDKYTKNKKYIPRLQAQLEKQSRYSDIIRSDKIIVPKVLHIDDSWTDECHGIMEYVYGKNFVAFFEYADKMIVDDFVETMIKYINEEISKSEIIPEYTTDELYNKWLSVKKNMLDVYSIDNESSKYIEQINNIIDKCDKIFVPNMTFKNFPVGICHGDLTFSNIIFRTNEYALIDFLDSFIDSPIIDIVKLRQDTKYMWSTLMYNSRDYDESRYKIICEYIDERLNKYFSRFCEFYNETYDIFQLMNFLRIVQYAKSDKVTEYLIKVINNILERM